MDPRLASGLAGGLNVGMKAYQAAPAISQFAQSIGQGAMSGATSGAALQGLGGIAGAALPIAGSLAGADPETQGYLGAAGTALGAGLAVGGGALASGGLSAMAAAGAAGAGGAAAAGTAALVMAPIAIGMIVKAISEGKDASEAMFNLKHRATNLGLSDQKFIDMMKTVAPIAMGIAKPQSPDQLASSLKQLNDLQKFYQDSGLESIEKGGGTSVRGKHTGNDTTLMMPEMQSQLKGLGPAWNYIDAARLQAEDKLGQAGWDAQKIQDATGRYIGGTEAALNWGSPEAIQNLRPTYFMGLQNLSNATGQSPEELVRSGAFGTAYKADGTPMTPDEAFQAYSKLKESPLGIGMSNPQMEASLQALKPGGLYQGLQSQLQPYGGFNPDWARAYDAITAAGQPQGPSGEAGKAVGRLQPRNVITGMNTLPRPEADARSEAVFGMRKPAGQGNPDTSGGLSTPPPVPGTSAAEPPAFGQGTGFAVAPGGNIGTGGLVTATPFGVASGQGNNSRGAL